MDEQKIEEVKNRLKMFLKDDKLVNEYIHSYGYDINMKKINDLKNQDVVSFIADESAMYKIEVSCPICKTKLDSYDLKAKSLVIKDNKFRVPFYFDGANYDEVDFTKYNVAVCPTCLFASPDKKDFTRTNSYTNKEEISVLNKNILHAIDDEVNSRISIINNNKKIIASFSQYPRNVQSAIYSYKLAISRALLEEKFMLPNAHLKHGGYILRLIKLSKELGETPEQITTLYVEACQVFRKGFETSNFSSKDLEFYNLYLLIAILLYVGRKSEALNYNSLIPKLIEECGNDKAKLKDATKWEKNIKDLFEYLDQVESWEQPGS